MTNSSQISSNTVPHPIQTATYAYLSAFIDELVRCGIKHACICPGSRSTPLAMRLADNPAIKVWMHLDERSAAFFALGMAKALTEPVILVCTSGTAAANFLPAVVEAYFSRIPLIVLTADRPPELRSVGAAQTIDQNRLYGQHTKWYMEVALPDSSPEMLRYIRSVADRACTFSTQAPVGPIHLNFPFREPLVPLPPDDKQNLSSLPPNIAFVPAVAEPRPYTKVPISTRSIDTVQVRMLAADFAKAKCGLIVVGPQRLYELGGAIARISEMLGFPILADVLSQLRAGKHEQLTIISTYDALLRDNTFVEKMQPDVVLRFGLPPTSKPLNQYLQKYGNVRQILVDGGSGWNDPFFTASDIVHAESRILCEEIINQLGALRRIDETHHTQWLDQWLAAEQAAQTAITATINSFQEPFEGRVFTELATLIPDGATLYVSSSMPVRDLDTFYPCTNREIRFLSNRGTNGIDGVVSSALGASASQQNSRRGPTVLVIGDIAMYHDMNGLLAARMHKLDLTIVLINNDGGGIFSFLPQAAYPEHFELLYGTPHGLDFSTVAALYGADYTHAKDWETFRSGVKASIAKGGLNIVEVRTNRDLNVKQHREIWKAVSESLASGAAGSASESGLKAAQ